MYAKDSLTSTGLSIPVSKTRALANAAMGINDLIPLWFGEPDVSTPGFICEAASASLEDGNTFYTEGLGKGYLRETIARYMTRLYGNDIDVDRIAVTVSGTNALNLAFQLLMNPGDKVVTTIPTFPTLLTVPQLQQAEIDLVRIEPSKDGWLIDIDHLIDRAKQSKILLINSPNNPTGWMLERGEIEAILKACRESGTWIISDEVYSRIVYDEEAAPSFAEFAQPEDRVIIVNSFSKSWAMTGWRLGWLTLPPSLLPQCEKLMEFSMSCAPEFVQAGGVAAIEQGENFVLEQRKRLQTGRDVSVKRLSAIDGISCIPPHAAFYVYFRISGVSDNTGFAELMAREANVGIAPGVTFDPSAHDWFRICFAKDPDLLNKAFQRMEAFLN